MRPRFRWGVGAAVLGIVLSSACGAAAAATQTAPAVIGAVHNPSSGTFDDSLSGTIAVATQDTAQGWYAYAPSYYNGDLAAISMANPANPTIVGETMPPNNGVQVYGSSTVNISGGVAYVVSKNMNGPCTGAVGSTTCDDNDNGSGNALSLFDVSTNPASPRFIGSISDAATPHNNLFGAYGVTVTTIGATQYAVVAAQGCLNGQPCPNSAVGNDLAMISLANPSSPQYVASVNNTNAGLPQSNTLDHPTAVAVSGNYAFVTSFYGEALTVVDISDPNHPTAVWSSGHNNTDFPAPADVAIQGNYAYVANQNSTNGQGTFTVVDISNPLSPQVVGTVMSGGMSGGYRVRVSGNTAYVAAVNGDAITKIDITVPADPIVIASTVNRADLYETSGLDLMNIAGNQYVVASSPKLSSEVSPQPNYPPYPTIGNSTNTSTGTITALELETAPANTAAPTITGTTAAGRSLTADVGTWTGTAPLTYAYQWQRCDKKGANCLVLKTATQTYPLGSTDIGYTLRVAVKATNAAGSSTATSAPTAVVTMCPATGTRPSYCVKPKLLTRPVVTGTTEVGKDLAASSGTWSVLPQSAYGGAQIAKTTVQWLRCNARGAHCKAIAHATHGSYRPTNSDLRMRLKLQVVAQNRAGSTTRTSAASAPIVKAGTRIRLSLSAPVAQRLVHRGFVVASIRSNVGAMVDVFFAVRVGHGPPSWTTGKPAEIQPGRALKFKLVLRASVRTRLRHALAAHEKLNAFVLGTSPGHPAIKNTKDRPIAVTG
jgi:hypothetical protein